MASSRGYGEGYIQERRNAQGKVTSYRVQVRLPGGRRKCASAKTHREAARLAQELGVEGRAGLLASGRRKSVGVFLEEWLKGLTVKPKTMDSYELNVRRLTRHIGGFRLDEIRPQHVQRLHAELRASGLKDPSIAQTHRVFHIALEQAVDWGLIARNPCDAVTPPRVERREMEPLTGEQAYILFESSAGADPLHPLWVFICSSGVRIGEALGLRWKDVDLEARTAHIVQTVGRINGGKIIFGTPKSASSRRLITLTELAVKPLRKHRIKQNEWRLQLGPAWQNHDLVFPSEAGRPWEPSRVLYRFHKALTKAGIPKRRVHDLRHTAATLMLEEGVPLKVVQEMLGHSSYNLTANVYQHVSESMQRQAAVAVDALFERIQARQGL
jgi:integrase